MAGKPRIVVIGPGRMGQGLGLALKRRGFAVALIGRTPREVARGLTVTVGPWPDVTAGAELVVVATPDDAVEQVARRLADDDAIAHEQVVLHLSGVLDRSALAPLDKSGAALGSFHPLQTVADPADAAARLKGAYVGIEGDERALVMAERLAGTLRMIPVRIPAEAKPAYHAGATFVANYMASLAGIAERLAARVGVPPELAARMYLPLLEGACANIEALGPRAALTGPVRRADIRTITAHLAALEDGDQQLYRRLGLEALRLAREAGMEEVSARYVEGLLSDEP